MKNKTETIHLTSQYQNARTMSISNLKYKSVFRQEINFSHFCMPDFAIMLQKDCTEYST